MMLSLPKNARTRFLGPLALLVVVSGCVIEPVAIIRVESIGNGMASLERLEAVSTKLGYRVEPLYSRRDQASHRILSKEDGKLSMAFRSTTYKRVDVGASYEASRQTLEIRFRESLSSDAKNVEFSREAVSLYESLLTALRAEFGAEKIIIERPAK